MSRIAVVGEAPRVDGWALAGAIVTPAAGETEVRRAWDELPDDVEVVVVTPAAAEVLRDLTGERLVVVLP
jgi:vacuolar-type H+-ATPase subunit F/Vma7